MHGIKSKLIIKILRGIGSFLWIISHIKSKNEVAISACDLVWESCHLFVPDQKPSLKVFFDSARSSRRRCLAGDNFVHYMVKLRLPSRTTCLGAIVLFPILIDKRGDPFSP